MLNKFNTLLIILLISLSGSDRINFGVNIIESFKITPFIILSFIFILFTLVFYFRKINIYWFLGNSYFFLSFSLFLCFVMMSAVFSSDIVMSIKRIVLLVIIITTFFLLLSEFKYNKINTFLISSSILGSILFFIFNIFMLVNWLGYLNLEIPQINLIPNTIGIFIPRLSGFSLDMNRGGFVLSFFTYIIWINRRNIKFSNMLIMLNIFMLIATLSRSTYILLIILFLTYSILFQRYLFNIQLLKYISIPLILIFLAATYMIDMNLIELAPVLKERFSLDQKGGSGAIHLGLIQDGISLLLTNAKLFFIGIGHGVSYILTAEYFGSDNKYGNFHSQYITIFIENGVFAFLSFLFFSLLYPIFSGKRNIYLPLLVALSFFNIFYQLTSEPIFWLIILLFYKYNEALRTEPLMKIV